MKKLRKRMVSNVAKIDVLNIKGEKVKDITLNDSVWNIEINEPVLTDAIHLALNSMRQGTHKTKGRSEVSGGGRKPWRQKGTGRARQGSTRSPQWVGGGTVFGPTPRSYTTKMNKKERALALKSALSDKFQNKELIVVDNLKLETNKTKDAIKTLSTLKAKEKTLIVVDSLNENAILATRNLLNVLVVEPSKVNALNIVNASSLLIDEASVKKIEEVLK